MISKLLLPYLKALLWTARVLSIVCIGMLLLFLVGERNFSRPISLTIKGWVGLLFFPLGIIVGMIAAWFREGIGAAITLASLAAFYIADILFTGTPPSGPYFLLFASPGFLFAAYTYLAWKQPNETH